MKFLCPFCYTEHDVEEILFRCANPHCEKEPDDRLEWYESGMKNNAKEIARRKNDVDVGNEIEDEEMTMNISARYAHVFSPSGNVKDAIKNKGAICDKCGERSYMRICPNCHNELSEYVYNPKNEKNMIVSVLGQRGAGKSVFLGVLLHEILEADGVFTSILGRNKNSGCVESVNDSRNRYNDVFGKFMYAPNDARRILEQTQSSILNAKESGAYRPFIYNFKYDEKSMFPSWIPSLGNPIRKSFDLYLFDAAGEDLENRSSINIANRYLSYSTGIVFLLDPMHLTEFVSKLQDEKAIRNAAYGKAKKDLIMDGLDTTLNVIEQIAERIRHEKGLKGTELIDIPLAVVVSKCDMFIPFLDADAAIGQTSPHIQARGFVTADGNQIDHEVKGFLEENGAGGLIRKLANNFSNVHYFAVSALGKNNNPKTNEKGEHIIARPSPHRIADPLLWLWHQEGILKAVQ